MVKYTFYTIACLLSLNVCLAQLTPEQRIQDSIIGWYSAAPKKITAPAQFEGKTFSIQQQENLNEITRWIRQTYTPVSGLGTHKRLLFITAGGYQPIKRFPPHSYGIDLRVWNVTYDKRWMDEKGHFKPVSEEYTRFYADVNSIPGTWPISWINNDDRYVFTWAADMSGSSILGDARNKPGAIHPNIQPWLRWQNKDYQSIFLVPGNKLPIVPVTKGELLQMAEESYDMLLKELRMTVEQQFSSSPKNVIDQAFESRRKSMDKYFQNIQKLKEKHRSTLNEPAMVRNYAMDIYAFETDPDPFIIRDVAAGNKEFYQVYRYPKDLLQKCKTDQPQWLVITVPYETKQDGNQLYEMYTSIIENFNYEYAYNYFFDPEKVKGKAYKPENEDQLKARLASYRNKGLETTTSVNTSSAPGILLSDDFSANTEGQSAKGWYMSTTGEHSTVATIQNEKGKWLKLGYNNMVSPFTLKKPLPSAHTIEFDMATDPFSTRTGGALVLYMSTYPLLATGAEDKSRDGAWIKLSISSGNADDLSNNNFRGEAKLELHTNPPLYRENFNEGAYYTKSLTEFTNKKTRLRVKLSTDNSRITLWLNDQIVATTGKDMKLAYGGACKDCNIPPGLVFNTIRWENSTSNARETGVYISNIRISKQ